LSAYLDRDLNFLQAKLANGTDVFESRGELVTELSQVRLQFVDGNPRQYGFSFGLKNGFRVAVFRFIYRYPNW
jgi:hypothetical protein